MTSLGWEINFWVMPDDNTQHTVTTRDTQHIGCLIEALPESVSG